MTGGRAFNPGWDLVFELGNLLTVSEAITRSALPADARAAGRTAGSTTLNSTTRRGVASTASSHGVPMAP